MDNLWLLAVLILLPACGSVVCLVPGQRLIRSSYILITTAAMIIAAVFLAVQVVRAGGHLEILLPSITAETAGRIFAGIDLVVLGYVIYRGLRDRRWTAPVLAIAQLAMLGYFEFTTSATRAPVTAVIDYLSLIIILLASVIGPLILVFSIGYMDSHEAHLHLRRTKQPRFFAVLFLFLAVMNVLVMADALPWVYTCWEVTTLCSFLLIAHDGTREALRNAFRTLSLNMLGGVAFMSGIIFAGASVGSTSLSALMSHPLRGGASGLFALAVALFCFAGFTKSAQFPFQSWLLGAMVAPTPVSALLHSSTMVKAGVYLVVRMSPLISGSTMGSIVAFAGGFTFAAASAIAISQRNGKRVLAYSTIANLGLIVCCAGIGTQAALAAAIMLIIFHALSKGLLFLCIGTIELHIHSRDIEDMQGLFKRMPVTTFITVLGMISMLLPPFGVLLTKWIAIEAAVGYPLVLLLIVIGSAFTVVFWAKWIGIILTMSYKDKYPIEHLKLSMSFTLLALLAGAVVASCAIAPLFNTLVAPQLRMTAVSGNLQVMAGSGGLWLANGGTMLAGGISILPLFLIVFALVFTVPYLFSRTRQERVKPPYFGGELAHHDIRGIDFIGPGEKIDQIVVHNYYMASIFGEKALTTWTSIVAIAAIFVMFGVAL